MMLRQPKLPVAYTGEGFKGEKLLSVCALLLTLFSTVLLIDLTLKQRKQTKMEMDEFKKKNGNS
jgi:hypothetical protein